MPAHATVLRVESGLILHRADQSPAMGHTLPYRAPTRAWCRVEALMRVPVHLALQAKRVAHQCDVVWAGSEHVGIPLSFLNLGKPLVVVAHHMEAALKTRLARLGGVVQRWDGIGYLSDEGKRFFIESFHVPAASLFQYESAKYLSRRVVPVHSSTGPIVSVGVAKRDYATLIAALSALHGYDTEIYATSKFGDVPARSLTTNVPAWVRAMSWVSDEDLLSSYRRARFVVVPLQRTTHSGAGINAVLEASALGKAVIATRTGGMATFVKDGETGILVPPHDASALRDAIRSLWAAPEVAERLGLAGRRYVEQRFDPKVVDDNIVAFLDNLRERRH